MGACKSEKERHSHAAYEEEEESNVFCVPAHRFLLSNQGRSDSWIALLQQHEKRYTLESIPAH